MRPILSMCLLYTISSVATAQNNVVLAGPAEPWIEDLSGQAIGIHSGRPTLQLQDLAVSLRAYEPESQHEGFVGCTISPRQESLAELRRFQQQIPRTVPDNRRERVAMWVSDGVRESLGMADVAVFGISPSTHFANVMIEADYRMKRIAVGVERPPVRMTTFAGALTTAQIGTLQRWWFTAETTDRLSDCCSLHAQFRLVRTDRMGSQYAA